jgi:hypothetical protein
MVAKTAPHATTCNSLIAIPVLHQLCRRGATECDYRGDVSIGDTRYRSVNLLLD